MQNKNQKQAFTLVELIVVITILAILGTIAFISLQGYSKSARDSRRVSDIQNIKKSLELFTLNTSKYPLPDNAGKVFYSGSLLWTQGILGDNVTQNLSRNLNSKPLDPLFETEYTYSVTNKQKEFELFSLFEGELSNIDIINNTYAVGEYIVRIDGNYNQIFIQADNYLIPSPSIVTAENLPLDFKTTPLAIQSQVIDNGTNIPLINGSDIETQTGQLDDVELHPYEGETNTSTGKALALEAIQNTYSGTTLATNDIYENILNAETPEEKVALFEVVVEKKIPTVSVLGEEEEEIVPSTLLDGLVSYYNFDNNFSDSVGDNNGNNNGTIDVDGIIGRGRSFDGVDDSIDFGDNSDFSFGNGESFTFSFTIKPNDFGLGWMIFSKEYSVNNGNYLIFVTNNGELKLSFYNGSSNPSYSTLQNIISENIFQHVVIQHTFGDENAIKIFVNDEEKNGVWSGDGYSFPINTTGPFTIGKRGFNNLSFLNGDLDEIGIWNRLLTKIEITELYNAGELKEYPFN